jgi:site-specific DNA-methyltransferase (adenine-specific)
MQPPTPNAIIEGDCIEMMSQWPDACVDHCIADPPFGIASGGGRGGKGKGLGWAFSSHVTMQEAWDRFSQDEFFQFNVRWLTEVCRVVKPNGNLLVFGTFHSIYQLGFILQNVLNRRILNSIIWFKPNAQPNITARTLTESTEQIIWAVNETPKRAKNWMFNYRIAKELSDDTQMRNLWEVGVSDNVVIVPVVPKSARRHPSQKPLQLVDRLVRLATRPEDVIMDPFGGSGVVALSALRYRRKYILIELLSGYVAAARATVADFPGTRRGKLMRRDTGLARLTDEELDILTETPVPQADDLDLVFKVPELVQNGAVTRNHLARQLSYVPRQGPYYADAAISVRLVEAVGTAGKAGQRLKVTELGDEWLHASESDRAKIQREAVLASPVVKYIASQLGVDPDLTSSIRDLLDEARVASVLQELDLSPNTAGRRAETICAWLKKILDSTQAK